MKQQRVLGYVVALALCAAGAASAGEPAVLQLPAAGGAGGTIEVQSFSWGLHKAGPSQSAGATESGRTGSGGGAGKANMQDLSVADATAARSVAVAGEPPAGSQTEVQFVVDPTAGPAAAALVDGCAKGKHFDEVVIVVKGQRRVATDATFFCAPPQGAGKQRELKGHVTLIK